MMIGFLVVLATLHLFLAAVSGVAQHAYPASRLQLFEREEEYMLHWATHRWVRVIALAWVYLVRYLPHVRTLVRYAEKRRIASGLYALACAFVRAMARAPRGVERRAFRRYAQHPNIPRSLVVRFSNKGANH